MKLFPQWYAIRGKDGYREYTDSKDVVDISMPIFGGDYEEVPGPSSNTELNQPQTRMGRMQVGAVYKGWSKGHDDERDREPECESAGDTHDYVPAPGGGMKAG
jgi:hypothetical protein